MYSHWILDVISTYCRIPRSGPPNWAQLTRALVEWTEVWRSLMGIGPCVTVEICIHGGKGLLYRARWKLSGQPGLCKIRTVCWLEYTSLYSWSRLLRLLEVILRTIFTETMRKLPLSTCALKQNRWALLKSFQSRLEEIAPSSIWRGLWEPHVSAAQRLRSAKRPSIVDHTSPNKSSRLKTSARVLASLCRACEWQSTPDYFSIRSEQQQPSFQTWFLCSKLEASCLCLLPQLRNSWLQSCQQQIKEKSMPKSKALCR